MPAVDGGVPDPPLVGPREQTRAGRAALERGCHEPVDGLCLSFLTRHGGGVQTHLADDERTVTGKVPESREVATKVLSLLEEHVERDEVELVGAEVFGRRVVGIGDEAVFVLFPHDVRELLDDLGDRARAHPTHHVGRNLIAQRQAQHDVGSRELPGDRPNGRARFSSHSSLVAA